MMEIVDKVGKPIREGLLLRVVVNVGPHGQMQEVEGVVKALYTVPVGATVELTKPAYKYFRDRREPREPGSLFYVSLGGEHRGDAFVCDKMFDDFEHGYHEWAEVL